MKIQAVLGVALLAFVAFVFAQNNNDAGIIQASGLTGATFTINANDKLVVAAWNNIHLSTLNGSILGFEANTFTLPQSSVLFARRQEGPGAAIALHTILGKLIEFVPANPSNTTTASFNKNTDTIVSEYDFNDAQRMWTPFILSSAIRGPEGAMVWNASTSTADRKIRIDYLIPLNRTDLPLLPAGLAGNATGVTQLHPTAMTADITITDYSFAQANSRLALQLFVASALGNGSVPAGVNLTANVEANTGTNVQFTLFGSSGAGQGFIMLSGNTIYNANSLQPVAVSNATATVLATGTVFGANVTADLAWSEIYVSFPRTNADTPVTYRYTYSHGLENAEQLLQVSPAAAVRPTFFALLATVLIAVLLMSLA